MVREQVETVARLYNECWGPGRLELVPEVLHPDIVWTAIESAPDSGTRRGHEECRAYMNDWLESFDLGTMPIEDARSAPDGRLVCALRGVGTERRTGMTIDIRYGAAFAFAPDGRLVEIHEYATHEEALEAVGLGGRSRD
jgi:ketosteroid isomerase-like protein